MGMGKRRGIRYLWVVIPGVIWLFFMAPEINRFLFWRWNPRYTTEYWIERLPGYVGLAFLVAVPTLIVYGIVRLVQWRKKRGEKPAVEEGNRGESPEDKVKYS